MKTIRKTPLYTTEALQYQQATQKPKVLAELMK